MPKRGEYIGLGGIAGEPSVGSLAWFASNPGSKYQACDASVYAGASLKVLALCSDQTTYGGFNLAGPWSRGPQTNTDGTTTQDGSGVGNQPGSIRGTWACNGRYYMLFYNNNAGQMELWTKTLDTGTSWIKVSPVGNTSSCTVVYAFGKYWSPIDNSYLAKSTNGTAFSTAGMDVSPGPIAAGSAFVCDGVLWYAGLTTAKYTTDGTTWQTASAVPWPSSKYWLNMIKIGSTFYATSLSDGEIKYTTNPYTGSWTSLDTGSGKWGTGGAVVHWAACGSQLLVWNESATAQSTGATHNVYAFSGTSYLGSTSFNSIFNAVGTGSCRGVSSNTGVVFGCTTYHAHMTAYNATPNRIAFPLSGNQLLAMMRDGTTFARSTTGWANEVAYSSIGPLMPNIGQFKSKTAYMKVL